MYLHRIISIAYINSVALVSVGIVQFLLYSTFLVLLVNYYLKNRIQEKQFIYLGILITSVLLGTLQFMCNALIKLNYGFSSNIKLSLDKFAYMAYISSYFVIILFINHLVPKKYKISRSYIIWFRLYGGVLLLLFTATLFVTSVPNAIVKLILPLFIMGAMALLWIYYYQTRHMHNNLILKKQITTCIAFWSIRYVIWDGICNFHNVINFFYNIPPLIMPNLFLFVQMALTLGICVTVRRLMQIRFLDINQSIDLPTKLNLEQASIIALQLNEARTAGSLHTLTRKFFEQVFGISSDEVDLHLVNEDDVSALTILARACTKKEVLVYHELVYTLSQKRTSDIELRTDLLQATKASLFVPLYYRDSLIAYITVTKEALHNKLLTSDEKNQIQLFAATLVNALITVSCKRTERMLKQVEKENRHLATEKQTIKNELIKSQFHNTLYKESFNLFLQNSYQRDIGILEYKSRKFVYTTQSAEKLLGYDINQCKNHPITKAVIQLKDAVTKYKIAQEKIFMVEDGSYITISALPLAGQQNVMFLLYRPDIAESIKQQLKYITNPLDWNYALYLETTKIGQLVHNYIPVSGTVSSPFKVNILKTVTHKKVPLIRGPKQDHKEIVDLLIKAYGKDHIHTIQPTTPEKNLEWATRIFGINQLFLANLDDMNRCSIPWFERLHGYGVLHLGTIEHLSLETQELLAEYIETGFYRTVRGTTKKKADLTILCSTEVDCLDLLQKGRFSMKLLNLLQAVTIPHPGDLSRIELFLFIDELTQRVCLSKNVAPITLLNHEKEAIHNEQLNSISALKRRVKEVVTEKLRQYTNAGDNRDLVDKLTTNYAAKLGKAALKDKEIMAFLWTELGNQTKIAHLLGVNRSTISRYYKKCKITNQIEQSFPDHAEQKN